MERNSNEEPYLPVEVRQLISRRLPIEDILRLCSTNPQWYQVCQDNQFWKEITFRDFPIPWHAKDQTSWIQIYRQNAELSQINVEGKRVYLVFVQTDLSTSEIPSLTEGNSIIYFWLKNFLRLRHAMTYVPGNLNPIEGTLTAFPDAANYRREISRGTGQPFVRLYYPVSVPGAQTELDLYNWMSRLQSWIAEFPDSYVETIITEDEEETPLILPYEYSEMDRLVLIHLGNGNGDYFTYDDQSRLFFGRGDEELATQQIYY